MCKITEKYAKAEVDQIVCKIWFMQTTDEDTNIKKIQMLLNLGKNNININGNVQ